MKIKHYVKRIKIEGSEHKLVLKTIQAREIKVIDEEQGIIEAYVSVFGNVDSYGDIVVKGAFADACKAFNAGGKYPKGIFGHDWLQPIAKTLEMREDDYGLYIKGKLILSVQKARETLDLIKAGVLTDFSFGYEVNEGKVEKDGYRYLYKITIYEWSPVLVGANPEAGILSAKAAPDSGIEEEEVEIPDPKPETETPEEETPIDPETPADPVEEEPAEATEEVKAADTITEELEDRDAYAKKWENFSKVESVFSALWSVYFDKETEVDAFPDLVKEAIALFTAVADGTDPVENSLTAAVAEKSTSSVFAKDLLSRLEIDVKETELKSGRTLSAKTVGLIKAALSAIDALDGSKKEARSALEDLLSSADSDSEGKGVEPVITREEARVVLKATRRSLSEGQRFVVRLKPLAGED